MAKESISLSAYIYNLTSDNVIIRLKEYAPLYIEGKIEDAVVKAAIAPRIEEED